MRSSSLQARRNCTAVGFHVVVVAGACTSTRATGDVAETAGEEREEEAHGLSCRPQALWPPVSRCVALKPVIATSSSSSGEVGLER